MSIEASVLEAAKRGDPMSLQSLGRMITPENYTLDLLQTCLIHLHGIVVPASPEPTPPSFGDTMNRCGAALICLTDVLRVAMLLSEPLKEATVETLLREFDDFINATDGLLRWTNWESVYPQSFIPLARLQQALDTTCQVIAFLIKLDERLQSAVIASTKAIDIALRVWCWRDPYNPSRVHLSPFMTEYRMEETIGMICTYTMSFEGGQAILSALLASSNLRRTFVKAFFDRLSQLTEIANQNPERGGAVMTQLKFMAMIAGFLGQHITFYRMLEKRGRFLGKACGLASQICSRGFGLPIVPPTGASLFHAAFVMASDTVAAVITVLNSGILVWMLKGISAVPQAPSFSSVEAALDKLYGYAFHHRSLPALSHALKGVPASVSQAVKRIDKVGTLYTGLVMEVERNEILVGTLEPRVILCDNPAHFSHRITFYETSYECSNCHSVVYCGTICQKEDWKRHKLDCSSFRHAWIVSKNQGRRYHHRTRELHCRIVEDRWTCASVSLDRQRRQAGVLMTDSVGIFVDVSARDQITVVRMEEYLRAWQSSTCARADVRALELVTQYRTRRIPHVRLVEGRFGIGTGRYVFLLAILQRDGRPGPDGVYVWRPMEHIARIVYVSSPNYR